VFARWLAATLLMSLIVRAVAVAFGTPVPAGAAAGL
jgi:hypothetical protein